MLNPGQVSAESVIAAIDGASIPTTTVATDDKVLLQETSDSDNTKTVTAQSIADLGGGVATVITASTIFEVVARLTLAVGGSGGNTLRTDGMEVATGASATSFARIGWSPYSGATQNLFAQSPTVSMAIRSLTITPATNTGTAIFGLGNVSIDGTSVSLTQNHIGFKFVKTGGAVNLYATQADGSTENASASLTTVGNDELFELFIKVNGTTSVDYYWRKNGGALSSATNLTTNLPTANVTTLAFGASNETTATEFNFLCCSATFSR